MLSKYPNVNSGEIVPSGFTYPNNAQVTGNDLYIRDANGNQILGRQVDNRDHITVLDVSYSKQLALVQYLAGSTVRQGYVTNATNLIKYYNQGQWHNGSTTEIVYNENGEELGSLSPWEKATPLYKKNGMIHVVYNTDKGINTKSGYVKYIGNSSSGNNGGSANILEGNTNESVSTKLIDFVKSYEGFYDYAYNDGTGVMTIGYGTIGKDRVDLGRCTEAIATEWLMEEINDMASQIKADLDSNGVILKQNEFDSLCSFAYNCGTTALLKQSNLYTRVCQGVRDESLRENFLSWTHGGGSAMPGLVRRRNAECDIFLYATYKNN